MFAFDRRLARIVRQTREPMLGQLRLAWWRDVLAQDATVRPRGDAVLDGLEALAGHETVLIAMVDAWEELLAPELSRDAIQSHVSGRAAPFIALAEERQRGVVKQAAQRWALADLAANLGKISEREQALLLAEKLDEAMPLPRAWRGLQVLEGLASRSLDRGGEPLMSGKGSALLALRIAVLGR